jgi:hypothetical protein
MQSKHTFFIIVFGISLFLPLACSSNGKSEIPVAAQTSNANEPTIKESPTPKAPTITPPQIISRQEWKAKDSIGEMKKQTPEHITIHHTASPQKEKISIEKKMQILQNFSQSESRLDSGKLKPVWPDIPYHYYIAVDGKIAEARDVNYAGDTNTDYNPSGHILIVLEGNFENEQPSDKQILSLEELTAWLSFKWKIPASEVKAHNDYASTACPGKNLKNLLPEIRKRIAEATIMK